ncbi:MAG: hypothetical protein J0H41_10320 [Rhizobiales bacterium]|nr:hypothetical protein [Hyphomicrobiales bacterium]
MAGKLSKDAIEALILLGGFAIVALAAFVVLLVWPADLYGAWRVLLTVVIGGLVAIPVMIAVRKKLSPPSNDRHP